MDIDLVYHKLKISFSNCAALLALACFFFVSPSNMLFAENIPTLPNPSDTQNVEEYYDTTVFDLYLNDTPIGNILANFSDTWFEIDSPGDVVEQLQSKITGGELKLQELCTGKIMGRREMPEIGSVIFDPNTFRIILSIDPKYLKVGGVSRSNLLPDPERALAIQQGVQITSSGNTSAFPASSSLSHRTRFSLGKSFLRGEGTFNQDNSNSGDSGDGSSYTLTELSAGTFWGAVRQDLGLLRSSGTRLVGSVEYAGTKVENTDQVLVDQDLVRGSPIRIFVPSRSRVEFFQGSRLLDSQILNAGLQEIDTSSFPQGSYDVEVRIHESSGNIIQERHFFAKSGLLAVQARPVITLEGGRLRNSSDLEEGYVYHGGLRWRALSFLQLEPAFFGSDTVKIGSLDLTGILGQTTFFLSGAYGSDKSKGLAGSLYGRLPLQISWNAGFQVSSDAKDSDSNTLETNKSGLSKDIAINPGLRSLYGRVERRFGNLSLSFMGNKTGKQEEVKKDFGPPEQDKDLQQPSYVYGPGFSYPLYTGAAGSIGLSGSYLWSDTRDG
ncbi:MAG: hypothetical protein GYA55_10495, partial [SAR324 cluster bacterium]|nr:hypothetical protein [SAR324 cluster bacterium]